MWRGDIHIGFGLTCGRHKNAGQGTQCKKQLAFGRGNPLSNDECVRALKNWLLAGFLIEGGDDARTRHVQEDARLLLDVYKNDLEVDAALRDFGYEP